MTRTHARFSQVDLQRALRAAAREGIKVSVDILPDGTIRLTPSAETSSAPPEPERRIVF